MHIHLLGRDVRLQRKILAKKQDDMHPIQYRFGATVSRPCVVGQKRTSLRKRCIQDCKVTHFIENYGKRWGLFHVCTDFIEVNQWTVYNDC